MPQFKKRFSLGNIYNMFLANKLKIIAHELKEHIPFTALGVITGVVFMLLFSNLSKSASHGLFAIFIR
jgi:hypothetical protein